MNIVVSASLWSTGKFPKGNNHEIFQSGRARVLLVPIYANPQRGFQPLRYARETYSSDVSAGNLFRNFLHLATAKTIRRWTVRPSLPENDLWLQASGKVPASCFCGNARSYSSAAYREKM